MHECSTPNLNKASRMLRSRAPACRRTLPQIGEDWTDIQAGAAAARRPRVPQPAMQVNDMIYYKKRDGRFTFEDFRSVLRFK
jgi:hypothetical protein